jgi:tRNA (guanine37-N1)-methyltransferase
MKFVKVLKKDAEKVKKELIKNSSFSHDYKIETDEKYVYFPVLKGGDVEREGGKYKVHKDVDVGSFDSVGDVVIVGSEVSDVDCKKLLERKDINVVLRKVGVHHGEFRTQDMEVVCGEDRKETIYKENGCVMKLDVEKCYFSPRLSSERIRIANLVKKGEKVLVLFSGVAPYCAVLAKHTEASKIVGVEKNPYAHNYAQWNVRKYKNVELFNCDVKDFEYKGKFDRVLMPLPKSAEDFLSVAVKFVKKGGMVHFYDFLHENDIPEVAVGKIEKKVEKFEIVDVVKCGQYSPRKFRICVDFVVE